MKAPILCSCEEGIECGYHKQERLAGQDDFIPTRYSIFDRINPIAHDDPTNPANWAWFGQAGSDIIQ